MQSENEDEVQNTGQNTGDCIPWHENERWTVKDPTACLQIPETEAVAAVPGN